MAHRKVPNAKQQPYSRPCKSTVPQSQTILAQQQEDDSIYAALKAICENLGIDYSSQLKKLKVHKWAVVVIIPTTGTDGKTYRMTVIDRKALTMWLATLNRKMPTTEITTAQDFIFDNMHIRIWLGEDGTIWYCAKDVAVALGYTNTSKAVKDHCKGVTKRYPLQTAGGTQTFTFIKRNDVYRLITSSKLPSAERFESWLFDEVVPSIHDHGAYITPTAMQQLASNPDFVINLGMALKKAQEKQAVAEAKVKELEPKAEALDVFTSVEGSYSVADAAKLLSNDLDIQIGRNRLYGFMAEINWVFRDAATNAWKAYQSQVDNGRLEMKVHVEHGTHRDGSTFPYPPTVRVTAKGLDVLRGLLRKRGTGIVA